MANKGIINFFILFFVLIHVQRYVFKIFFLTENDKIYINCAHNFIDRLSKEIFIVNIKNLLGG